MKIQKLLSFSALILLTLSFGCSKESGQHTFSLADSTFMLDDKPFQIISGEIHYPRVPREAWRDRMKMAKAMGLNTIGTYVFWNLHEPEKGKFDFSGNNDIAEFVKIAKQEGLWVILRPSPYVCAEWEFGGYPYWLQNEKGLQVRSREKQYLAEYKKYIQEIGKQLAPLQINHGGNILMVQVENEYGSYGADKVYLEMNRKMFVDAGFDGLLYTCDPEKDIVKGHLKGLMPAINGQDNPVKVKQAIKGLNEGKGPFFIAEWYPAWFDWWGTAHHKVPAAQYTGKLDTVLAAGISINMYMFHGGSTRGFMNGANFRDTIPFEPQISSYDYDAPLDEAGNATDKFMKFREVIAKHLPKGEALPAVPEAKPSTALKEIVFDKQIDVFEYRGKGRSNSDPLTFEDMNQAYGYMIYKTNVNGGKKAELKIDGLRDYGIVFIDGERKGTLDRRLGEEKLLLDIPAGVHTLEIFVENMGRINFGPNLLKNKKGIIGEVSFAGHVLKSWTMYSLPFDRVETLKLKGSKLSGNVPTLKSGSFDVVNPTDTYLDFRKWGKGVVWVNGHNLGKYWSIGPQQTIYLPAEWQKKGRNEVVVLELNKPENNILTSLSQPILDDLQEKK
ncbi:beta-galactosidase family protein [Pedobacter sp. Leaf176]|uniref:glycoside hydrolase family 35 protein n=1 Tax=Pedobacter sp. Leaf176 TaxID=1736286 RepID=UPI0006FB7B4E|nr:beta-galactosidase family protein [Pedobacter sp. Leaf176]KQR70177.1 beta-galactosidase [Pedobacter sp. Leaf176]